MIAFKVNDMTCGHCTSAITKALKSVDAKAEVTIDLAKHLVMVAATESDANQFRDAISEAGYTPVPVETPTADIAFVPSKSGGRCGSCH